MSFVEWCVSCLPEPSLHHSIPGQGQPHRPDEKRWQPQTCGCRETLRRLEGTALRETTSKDFTDYLPKNICEAIVNTVRSWLHHSADDTSRCHLAVDLENAINQIDRSCFLREVRCVARTCFCKLRHLHDSFVLFGPEKISSRRRVQQKKWTYWGR